MIFGASPSDGCKDLNFVGNLLFGLALIQCVLPHSHYFSGEVEGEGDDDSVFASVDHAV